MLSRMKIKMSDPFIDKVISGSTRSDVGTAARTLVKKYSLLYLERHHHKSLKKSKSTHNTLPWEQVVNGGQIQVGDRAVLGKIH